MTDSPTQSPRTFGRVVSLHGKLAHVVSDDGKRLECAVRGKFKQGKRQFRSPISVGDRIGLDLLDNHEGRITEILPRHGVLSRPSAHLSHIEQVVCVNVDQLIITLSAPKLREEMELLDRLLISGTSSELGVSIVVNKIDLDETARWRTLMLPYEGFGHPILGVSALTGEGIEDVRALLKDRISVFAGASGVGKSTTLNALQPGLALRTSEVSEKSGLGRHTTTHVSLLELDCGGFVVDTPGVREFGLWRISRRELPLWYPDYAALLGECRYKGCGHTHEPHCAVKQAVEDGKLDQGRYARYLAILADIQEEEH